MADEAEGSGTLEAAAAQLREARTEAAAPEPKPEADGAETATEAATESPPEQLETADAVTTEEAPDDAGQEPTVTAPASFTPEEKALFKTLPPEQQQSVLRLAKGVQAAESRRHNEHTEALREAQAVAEAAEQERQYFANILQQYKNPLVSSYQQRFADVLSGQTDILRLSQDQSRWNEYQAYQAKFAQIAQQEQLLSQQTEKAETERLAKFVKTRNTQLVEAHPELKDPAKFEKYDMEISNYLRGLEVPDERIARISYEELMVIEKAMKWDNAQKAKALVPKPQANTGQPQGNVRQMPRVMKSGTGNNAGVVDDKIAAMDQRARTSGSVDDAAERLRLRRLRGRA